ncbi:MAG: hypothetical protein EOP84_30275 [Verrucomicrobiaceae bacterium]|nr:MAG: hypothetical protein EOP84_30275 [Verrucomicrobiaceae bacterium]
MKIGIIGCLAGSAAAMLFSGCAADHHATTTTYGSGYVSVDNVDPVLVERRTVYIDSTPREVPIYRTGDTYFYTYGGRRFAYAYPGVRRTVGARYGVRDWDRRDWDRGDLRRAAYRSDFYDDRRIRRSAFRRDAFDDGVGFDTTPRYNRGIDRVGGWNRYDRVSARRSRLVD